MMKQVNMLMHINVVQKLNERARSLGLTRTELVERAIGLMMPELRGKFDSRIFDANGKVDIDASIPTPFDDAKETPK